MNENVKLSGVNNIEASSTIQARHNATIPFNNFLEERLREHIGFMSSEMKGVKFVFKISLISMIRREI